MKYDVTVVGGGIAGLTAAAYLAKSGHTTLLCEKERTCGGLVNTFERDGFFYDGGIRAMENSGVLFPMLKHLGPNIRPSSPHCTQKAGGRSVKSSRRSRRSCITWRSSMA